MRVRGFISLLGSRALNAPYEWAAWVNWALEAGVSQETVDAIHAGHTPENLTAEESLIARFCTELISGNHRLSSATFQSALDHFGPQGLVELVVTLGYFAMIALPLNAFEIEMTSEQKGMRKAFKPLAVKGKPYADSGAPAPDAWPIAENVVTTPGLSLLSGHQDVAPEHQHFVDRIVLTRGGLSALFQVLLHTPDVANRISNIGAFFLYETVLAPAVRTLTWLIAARELDCNYVWQASAGAARTAGVSEELIAALEKRSPLGGIAGEHAVLFDYCHQVLRGNYHVSDATYHAAVSKFGVSATVQITATLGYIVMISLVANAFDIPAHNDDTRPAL
jgi:4-carboxymuconolactone decarboxylase